MIINPNTLADVYMNTGAKVHVTVRGTGKTLCGRTSAHLNTAGRSADCTRCAAAETKIRAAWEQQQHNERLAAENTIAADPEQSDDTMHTAATVYAALYDTEETTVALIPISALRDAHSSVEPGTETHTMAMVSGRIGGMRIGGQLCFATITDATDSVQIMTSGDRVTPDMLAEWKAIPNGSHVTATGEVTMSNRGILSIMAESWVATEPEPTPVPELTIELSERKGWVRVSLAGQQMEIRSGSDVRWRAAVWALGHGYRLARKGSRAWQQRGRLSVANVTTA